MSHDTIIVGLDYHRMSIQVCVLNTRGEVLLNRLCGNSSAAIKATIDRFCAADVRVALEACCGSAELADAGMIKAGRPQLRVVLIEAAHRLARYEPRWKEMSIRLRRKGKPGSAVAAAIANCWMRWQFHQVQHPNLAV